MLGRMRDRLAIRPKLHRPGTRPIVADVKARQGPRGKPVLIVLLGSFVLLGIYLTSMMVWAIVDAPLAPREQVTLRERVAETVPPVVPSSALNTNDPPAANPAYPVPAVPYVK